MSTPRSTHIFLAVGILAVSQSGNLVRIGDAPAVSIAAWRLVLAALFLAPLARGQFAGLACLGRRELVLFALAGGSLAAHLIAWIAAVQHTTVANAAIFFAVNPVITATAAYFIFGERMSWRLVGAIGAGLLGILVIGWRDLSLAREHLLGDGLALLCSVLFTVYFLVGKSLRQKIPTELYVTVIYGVAGLVSFAAVAALEAPLIHYSPRNWLCFLLLAAVPTMIGHTSFNHALRHMEAGRISTATLAEPPLAGLVAYLAWGETVGSSTIVGYLLISLSILLLIFSNSTATASASSGED